MNNLFDVKGKVVLVTGGGKGIGLMIATGYVSAGSKVYIASRSIPNSALEELNKLGKQSGGQAIGISADLSTVKGCEDVADVIRKKEGKLHVLVNNAGNNWGAPFDEYPDQAWNRVLGLNLQRVFTLTQKLTPLLLASLPADAAEDGPWSDPARIINIGSVDGIRVPKLETYAYSSSKAALHQLSRVFASQLGKRGITSNTLACGPFESKMMAATLKAAGDTIVAGVPLGRIGSPEDVAGACIFLSSRAGAWINGSTIAVDGGALVGGRL